MKILILCAADPAKNPRPSRLIGFLKKDHEVVALGIESTSMDGVEVLSYPKYSKRNLFQEILLYVHVFLRRWDALIFTKNRLRILEILQEREFDVIVCHDLVLLPLVLLGKKKSRVIFDAREFYPAQGTHSLRWRILFKTFNHYLCKTYLRGEVDKILCVGKGIGDLYKRFYGISTQIFYSFSSYCEISPTPVDPKNIKLLYHGSANRARKIENMIYMMDFLPSSYSLDLILVFLDEPYKKFLCDLVASYRRRGKRVRILPPVDFKDLVFKTSHYDLGIYGVYPSTLNLKYALPNKFFEYIQARLALVVFPHHEMEFFLKKYKNGVASAQPSASSLAECIMGLSVEEIRKMKNYSHRAARFLNFNWNEKQWAKIQRELE